MIDYLKPLDELLSPEEVVWRPHEDFSGIGWHLGHHAHVAHVMIGDLTAAEPGPDPELDGIMDSANPEKFRGVLPTVDQLSVVAGHCRVDGYLLLNPLR